LERLKYAKP